MFKTVFTFVRDCYFTYNDDDDDSGFSDRGGFLSDCKSSMLLFDEYLYLMTRYLIFYQPDETEQTLDSKIILNASVHEVPLLKYRKSY